MSLLRIRKTSAWKFQTSATGGLGVGFFVASGGGIALIDPKSKGEDHPTWLHYAGAGVGASVGLRKIPKVGPAIDTRGLSEKGSGNLAPASFWNHGIVYVMNGCSGDDLELTDFKGPCCFVDVGAGLVAGYAGFGLLMKHQ